MNTCPVCREGKALIVVGSFVRQLVVALNPKWDARQRMCRACADGFTHLSDSFYNIEQNTGVGYTRFTIDKNAQREWNHPNERLATDSQNVLIAMFKRTAEMQGVDAFAIYDDAPEHTLLAKAAVFRKNTAGKPEWVTKVAHYDYSDN